MESSCVQEWSGEMKRKKRNHWRSVNLLRADREKIKHEDFKVKFPNKAAPNTG